MSEEAEPTDPNLVRVLFNAFEASLANGGNDPAAKAKTRFMKLPRHWPAKLSVIKQIAVVIMSVMPVALGLAHNDS